MLGMTSTEMAIKRAVVNRPCVNPTTTPQELEPHAIQGPKVGIRLPQKYALAWNSPVWAQVTSSSVQLSEADKGQQKGLRSMFADLLPTAPISTPFVFHDVQTRPSNSGNDVKPDVALGLREKPCIPLTAAGIINFKLQGRDYDFDEVIGKTIICGRLFLQQVPQILQEWFC